MTPHAHLAALALLLLPACSHAGTPVSGTPASGEAAEAASGTEPAAKTEPTAQTESDADEQATTQTDEADAAKKADAPNDNENLAASRSDAAPCEGGVIYDDGGLETGYGFVPSAAWGRYLQAYDSADLASRMLDTVCVCWLRTREVDRIEFEVVVHRDAGGRPATEAFAQRTAVAEGVPKGKEAGGKFYAVDMAGIEVPEGRFYVGVRFDPGAARFSFVCADHSPGSRQVAVFQQEDRAPAMAPVIGSSDPVFSGHRAMMLRLKAAPPAKPQPAP